MAETPVPPDPWVALPLPTIESKPKRVVEADTYYIGKLLTQRQIEDLDRIRGLIRVGGDLSGFYRRSVVFDELLRRMQVMHLHLGGPGSDAILYLIQYPGTVLFLCVDGHIHLDAIPPGRNLQMLGRRRFEAAQTAAHVQNRQRVLGAVRALLGGRPKPK